LTVFHRDQKELRNHPDLSFRLPWDNLLRSAIQFKVQQAKHILLGSPVSYLPCRSIRADWGATEKARQCT